MDAKIFFQDHPIAYHPILAKAFNSVTAALFLSQIAYWNNKGKDPDGWIYKTQVEMQDETGLSRCEQETARALLKRLGVLKEERRGQPARLWYLIDWEKLTNLIAENQQSSLRKTRNLDAVKPANCTETTTEITTETTRESAFSEENAWPSEPLAPSAPSLVESTGTLPSPTVSLSSSLYPSRKSPAAAEARRQARLAKKALVDANAEIVANWPAPISEHVQKYVHAYLRGVAPDGREVHAPDAAILVKQAQHVCGIDPQVFSPEEFESAARYYFRTWNGMLSIKRLREELSAWDAKGRPRYKPPEGGATKETAFEEQRQAILRTLEANSGKHAATLPV